MYVHLAWDDTSEEQHRPCITDTTRSKVVKRLVFMLALGKVRQHTKLKKLQLRLKKLGKENKLELICQARADVTTCDQWFLGHMVKRSASMGKYG